MKHSRRSGSRIFRTLAVSALALTLGVGARADAVLSFNAATGTNAANQDQSVGWQFDVLSPITVTGLGWYDENGDGLAVGHTVGIWDSAGTLLASAFVPAGVAASMDGQFRTVDIVDILLPAGTGYIVGGQNFFNNSERLAANVTQTVDPRISFVDATFSGFGGFQRPTNFSSAVNGFYGPSFSVGADVVPEPASMVLFVSGGAGLLLLRRKRK